MAICCVHFLHRNEGTLVVFQNKLFRPWRIAGSLVVIRTESSGNGDYFPCSAIRWIEPIFKFIIIIQQQHQSVLNSLPYGTFTNQTIASVDTIWKCSVSISSTHTRAACFYNNYETVSLHIELYSYFSVSYLQRSLCRSLVSLFRRAAIYIRISLSSSSFSSLLHLVSHRATANWNYFPRLCLTFASRLEVFPFSIFIRFALSLSWTVFFPSFFSIVFYFISVMCFVLLPFVILLLGVSSYLSFFFYV